MKRKSDLDLSGSKKISKDKNYFLDKIKKNVNMYDKISDNFKYDKDIILEVINNFHKKYSTIYQNLPEDLKSDKDIILLLIKNNYNFLEYAPLNIKNDYDIMLEAVKTNGSFIYFASPKLQKNYHIVLEAVKRKSSILEYVHPEFKNNYNIVLEAVKKDGSYIEYASSELKNNPDIVLEAVKNRRCGNSTFFKKYISKELKNNYDFILKLVTNDYNMYKYISNKFKDNFNIALIATQNHIYYFDKLSDELKNNKQFILELSYNSYIYIKISFQLKIDEEIVLKFLSNYDKCYIINDIPQQLYHNKNFILKVLQLKSFHIDFIKKISSFYNDKEIMLKFLKRAGECLQYIPEQLQNDKDIYDIILYHVNINPFIFNFISNNIKYKRENLNKLININCLIIEFLPNNILNNKLKIFNIINYLLFNHKDKLLDIYNKILNKLSDDIKLFSQEIIDISYHNKFDIDIFKKNCEYLHNFINYNNNLIINNIYDTNSYDILLLNKKLFNYFSENIIKYPNLANYLLENKLYKIIYNHEEINEYIKDNNHIIIKSISDIDIENEYDKEEIKETIEKQFQKYKIIWIN